MLVAIGMITIQPMIILQIFHKVNNNNNNNINVFLIIWYYINKDECCIP